jgi:hypothetical protein
MTNFDESNLCTVCLDMSPRARATRTIRMRACTRVRITSDFLESNLRTTSSLSIIIYIIQYPDTIV